MYTDLGFAVESLKGGRLGLRFLEVGRPLELLPDVGLWRLELLLLGVTPSGLKEIRRVGVLPEVVRFGVTVEMKPNSVA